MLPKKRLMILFFLFLFLFPGKSAFADKGTWVMTKKEWTYVDSYGKPIPGWLEHKGDWYYIDPARERMLTGWLFHNGKWYFLSNRLKSLGKMYQSWCTIDGYAYYFDESGAMAEKTTVQGRYPVNENGQYLGNDGKPQYYEKSIFRTKPSTVMDELMAKAKREQEELSEIQIGGIGNPTFLARYGHNPNGIFDPGPQNPWAEKDNIDMEQYNMKEEDFFDFPDTDDGEEDREEEAEEEDEEDD